MAAALLQGCSNGNSESASGSGSPPPPPPPPAQVTVSLSVAPPTITLGDHAELVWRAQNATSCVASGSWSGERAVEGRETVTPSATGAFAYALTCTGPGQSGQGGAQLEVTAPPADPLAEARETFAELRAMEQGCCASQ